MSRIYTSMNDFERAQEEEFRAKVTQISNLGCRNEPRRTLDGEWTFEELHEDIIDEASKILKGHNGKEGWLEKHKHRVVRDENLKYPEFIAEHICSNYDIIEAYNRAYDNHRNDKPMKFGIVYFDEVVIKEINKLLKENLVT